MPTASPAAVADFRERTWQKLAGVRCPEHRQPPRLKFEGETLKDVSIRMSGCCAKLIALANQAILVTNR